MSDGLGNKREERNGKEREEKIIRKENGKESDA
jgi:hypothetical protein